MQCTPDFERLPFISAGVVDAPTDPVAAAALVSTLAKELQQCALGRVGYALILGGVDFDQVGANGYTALAWAASCLCRSRGDGDADRDGATSSTSTSSTSSHSRTIFEMMLLLSRFVTARANERSVALAQEKALAEDRARAAAHAAMEVRADDGSDADEELDAFDATSGADDEGVGNGAIETDKAESEYCKCTSED